MSTIWDKLGIKRTPVEIRNTQRRISYYKAQYKVRHTFFWTNGPILGYVFDFWTSIMDEGIRSTCIPRWGMVTFAYLNDGIKPSLWHTLYELIHHGGGKYSGIYPSGAPTRKPKD